MKKSEKSLHLTEVNEEKEKNFSEDLFKETILAEKIEYSYDEKGNLIREELLKKVEPGIPSVYGTDNYDNLDVDSDYYDTNSFEFMAEMIMLNSDIREKQKQILNLQNEIDQIRCKNIMSFLRNI